MSGRPALGLILAGGAGQRMGGKKPWRLLEGKPLIAHMAALAGPQVERLAIASNGPAAEFAAYSDLVLADRPAPGLGPLGGIAAGLAELTGSAPEGWLALFPVDMPRLPPDLAARLLAAATRAGARGAYALCGANGHYLAALFHASLAANALALAAGPDRRVRALHAAAGSVALQFGAAAARAFADLNTAEAISSASAG
ncbi:molybdenum cofactor guanylyltransferase [Radicibacter daui]|uniref:molybdenum cofactor guanylyltransferase n=1 Tax=Radicibacter daui TaxID=3064829 RepID=UPI004046E71E